ncbi:MAG: tetratricopeptide repeat protein [Candidatus Latescibacteria bacterium]|nr:tetratricopeptide repeat protein [Candidatus Latescibacterota bacterium]
MTKTSLFGGLAAFLLSACTDSTVDLEEAGSPTFNRDIAPIVFTHCAPCHRPGEIAPFPLLSYTDVSQRAGQIVLVTESRFMPPWKPAPGHGRFIGERGLSQQQIDLIQRWYEAGEPEGDPADLPPAPTWTPGWQLGQPDLVVQMPHSYTLPAEGVDIFRNFVIPVPLEKRRYVKAVEFRPGNARVVHHATMMIDRTGSSRAREQLDPEPGFDGMSFGQAQDADGHFLGWTPGRTPYAGSDSLAWALDPGTDLVAQLHMLPTGKPEPLQASVGLFFARQPPTRTPAMLRLGRKDIDIPAGISDYRITDSYQLPVDLEVITIYPHAHYLGSETKAYATLPDGRREWLIWIRQWDFNWQDDYRFAKPVFLPRGSTLHMEYTYDNSAANPLNPNTPPQRVLYGLQSADEMGDLTLQVLPRRPSDLPLLRRDFHRKWVSQEIQGYQKIIQVHPGDFDMHHTLAMFHQQAGQADSALVHFETALQLQPDYTEARVNLGIALASRRQFDQAIKHFRSALESDPNFIQAHFNLGLALHLQGRPHEARPHLDAVIAQRPAMAPLIEQRLQQLRQRQ